MTATYLVERQLAGITAEQLDAAHRCVVEAARRLARGGPPVRLLRCVFVEAEARCLCLFAADSEAAVRAVNEVAQVPYRRIAPVVEYEFERSPS
jgi:hypothetical protein